MHGDETALHRSGILLELEGLLRESFALEAWGRLVVELARDAAGVLRVADLVVEEIVGDDALVDRVYAGAELRACLPALARAVETLCLLEGLDVDALGGGTILRRLDRLEAGASNDEASIVFLPGKVRMPSRGLDARRDALLDALRAKNDVLRERWSIGAEAHVEADMLTGEVAIRLDGRVVSEGKQVVFGSFASAARSWVWGAHNPSLEPEARKRSAAMLDRVRDRSGWEIATPGFQTDEPTTWLLAALLAEASGADGVVRVGAGADGYVLLGLFALAPA